jgi:hypothetical protein
VNHIRGKRVSKARAAAVVLAHPVRLSWRSDGGDGDGGGDGRDAGPGACGGAGRGADAGGRATVAGSTTVTWSVAA